MPTTIERSGLFRGDCPYDAGKPSASVRWSSVGFVHWSYPPEEVARLLPANLQADLYGGKAWVGYQFLTVVPSGARDWLSRRSTFDEMRLRVCVVDENGLPGLFHLSVDVSRSSIARGQRRALNLPAFYAKTRFSTDRSSRGTVVDYRCRRTDGTTSRLTMVVGRSYADTDVDRFLTGRWRVVLPNRFWIGSTENRWVVAAHDRWSLYRSSVLAVDDDALLAAGLPAPAAPAQALWSPAVDVRLSIPRTGTT